MQPISMPNITVAQVVAVVGSIIGLLVAAGLDLSKDLQDSIINLITVVAGLLLVSDAGIRHGRSRSLLNAPKGEVPADDGASLAGPGA